VQDRFADGGLALSQILLARSTTMSLRSVGGLPNDRMPWMYRLRAFSRPDSRCAATTSCARRVDSRQRGPGIGARVPDDLTGEIGIAEDLACR
jgi:hypothetical protein